MKEEVHFETINLYWDFYEEIGYEDQPEEDVYANDYNLRSNRPLASINSPKVTYTPKKNSAPKVTLPPYKITSSKVTSPPKKTLLHLKLLVQVSAKQKQLVLHKYTNPSLLVQVLVDLR